MRYCYTLKNCVVSTLLLVLCTSFIYAKEDSKRVKKTSEKSQTGDFECGTYKGIEKESLWYYYQYQNKIKNFSPLSSTDFVYDDVWVVEDDGTTHVEHEWSHVDPYGKKKTNSGTRRIPVDEFLAGDHDATAKSNLDDYLKKRDQG